jgi:alkanesulfonate monooxygenase SsuD/methylene tetrahydromethanopterin reductase-like flavin-dependent oxidoreductase (luciferase family)
MLGGLAATTSRVRLGPLVACLAFHPPGLLARMAATVDEISGGRLVLGVGAGWNRAEFEAFGLPYDRRASRFEEAFSIVQRLVNRERVTAKGRHWQTREAVLLPEPARRIPLMIGSNGERLLAATLPHVDAWNTWFDAYGNTPEGFAKLNAKIDDAARGAGRLPEEIRRSACVRVALKGSSEERPLGDIEPLAGSAGEIARGLRAMADAGADEVILVVTPITERTIAALGETLTILDGA